MREAYGLAIATSIKNRGVILNVLFFFFSYWISWIFKGEVFGAWLEFVISILSKSDFLSL